jgi:hypothetical protein
MHTKSTTGNEQTHDTQASVIPTVGFTVSAYSMKSQVSCAQKYIPEDIFLLKKPNQGVKWIEMASDRV